MLAGSKLIPRFPRLTSFRNFSSTGTGGVSAENARDYLAAGAVALGIGGNLVPKKAVATGAFEQITAAAQACVAAVQ